MKLRLGKWDQHFLPLTLPPKVYQWPMHVLGVSGSGKSWLLANLALRLNELGEGVLVIDHKDGQLATDIVTRADPARLIYVSPGQCYFDGHPHHWGLNPLEVKRRDRLGFGTAYSNTMKMFERMERANFLIMQQMRLHLDAAIRLSLYKRDCTLLDVRRVLTESAYAKHLLTNPHVPDELREHFTRFHNTTKYAQTQAINSSIPRLKEFLTDPQLYFMVTQPISTIHLDTWLNQGKLVVVDVATEMTNSQSLLLGNLMLAVFLNDVFTRIDTSRVWRLIADEFDVLAGDNFTQLIDKARSYNAYPVMANQNLSQLERDNDTTLLNSVRSARVRIYLRTSQPDADTLHLQELSSLDPYTAHLELSNGLPGLLDSGESATLLLDPLSEARHLVSDAVASQLPHVVSERLLREKMEGNDDDPEDQSISQTQGRESSRSQESPVRDRPLSSDGLPGHVRGIDELAAVQAAVLEPAQRQRRDSGRVQRQNRRQPQVPDDSQEAGSSQGEAHRDTGEGSGLLGDELSDRERTERLGEASEKPRPGHSFLPPPSEDQ